MMSTDIFNVTQRPVFFHPMPTIDAESKKDPKDMNERELEEIRQSWREDPEYAPLLAEAGDSIETLKRLLNDKIKIDDPDLPADTRDKCAESSAYLLTGMASPMLIMQEMQRFQEEQSYFEKKLANQLGQSLVKIREANRKMEIEAANKDRNSALTKAATTLGITAGGAAMAQGINYQRYKSKAKILDRKIDHIDGARQKELKASLEKQRENIPMSRLSQAIQATSAQSGAAVGEAVTSETIRKAQLLRANVQYTKSVLEEVIEKMKQHEMASQDMRRRAAEMIISSVKMNADTQQSVSFRL